MLEFFRMDIQEYHILHEFLTDHELSLMSQCCKSTREYQTFFSQNGCSPSLLTTWRTFSYLRKRFHRYIAKQKNLRKLRIDYKDVRTAKPEFWQACASVEELEINPTFDTMIDFMVEKLQKGLFSSLQGFIDYSFVSSGQLLLHLPCLHNLRHLHIENHMTKEDQLPKLIMQGNLNRLESIRLRRCTKSLMDAMVQCLHGLRSFHCERLHVCASQRFIVALREGCFPALEELSLSNFFNEDLEWYDHNFSDVIDSLITWHTLNNQAPILRLLHLTPEIDVQLFIRLLNSPLFSKMESFSMPIEIYRNIWGDGSDHPHFHEISGIVQKIDLSFVKRLLINYIHDDDSHVRDIHKLLFFNETLRNVEYVEFEGIVQDILPCLEKNHSLHHVKIHLDPTAAGRTIHLSSLQHLELTSCSRKLVFSFLQHSSFPALQKLHVHILSWFSYDEKEEYEGEEEKNLILRMMILKLVELPQLRVFRLQDDNEDNDDFLRKNKIWNMIQSIIRNRL